MCGRKEKSMKRLFKSKLMEIRKQYSIVLVILVLGVLFTAMNGRFISEANLINIVRQASVMIIVGCGAKFIMIAGDVDISVGGVACLCAVITSVLIKMNVSILLAIFVGVLTGALFGLISGVLVSYFAFPPMIATLGMMNLCTGIANLVTNGTAISNLPEQFQILGRGYVGVIPILVIITILITASCTVVLSQTTFGRYIYAIGGNATVAKMAGINVHKIRLSYYVIGGICSAIAGILITSRMGSAQPTLGTSWPMDIIAGVVIGGTHFKGGSGTIVNTVFGVILMTMITNGLNLLGVNTFWQQIVTALLLIFTIVVNFLQDKNKVIE